MTIHNKPAKNLETECFRRRIRGRGGVGGRKT